MSVIGQGAQTFLPNNPHTVILFVCLLGINKFSKEIFKVERCWRSELLIVVYFCYRTRRDRRGTEQSLQRTTAVLWASS